MLLEMVRFRSSWVDDVIVSHDQASAMASSPTLWVALLCCLPLQLHWARGEVAVLVSVNCGGNYGANATVLAIRYITVMYDVLSIHAQLGASEVNVTIGDALVVVSRSPWHLSVYDNASKQLVLDEVADEEYRLVSSVFVGLSRSS